MTARRFLVRARGVAALGFLLTLTGAAQGQAGGAQPVAWFRPDAIRGVADGAAVAAWPDSSGNKNDAAQPVAAQRPMYVLRGINGLPAVHFTAEKSTQLVLPRPVQDDFTIVCVFRSAQGIGSGDGWYSGAGLVDGEVAGPKNDFGLSLSARGQVLGGTGSPDTTVASDGGFNDGKPHVVTFKRTQSAGAISLYVDGGLVDSGMGGVQALTDPPRLTLGSIQVDTGFLTGDIAEVQIYATALSDSDRQALEKALKTKYGITTSPTPASPPAAIPASARLTPMILPYDPQPAIHGPKIVGASPLHPFLFLIPATGADRRSQPAPHALTYTCANLPPGLTLDAKTGVISGAVRAAGMYTLHLSVSNDVGTASRDLTLVCGDHPLALTPPMGWDAFNVYANQMDDEKARAAADWLVSSGLAEHGWSYVHVSDTWQAIRDKKTGNILPNRRRYPNMKALGDYIHDNGLKFGLSTSVTEHTCAGYPGSGGFLGRDADSYASWGVDYLEASWCPMATLDENPAPKDEKAAFKEMRDALNKTNRDIVMGLNTFGNANPWDLAAFAGANTWVTTQVLFDDWKVVQKAVWGRGSAPYDIAPGHWNDPGLLMVGRLGYPAVHKTRLREPEQMAQISQAALMSAPLWLSCDPTALDPNAFHPSTTAMLTNDEVIDVDQDTLGKGANQVQATETAQVWAKPLADGTQAVGLFNFGDDPAKVTARLSQLGLSGAQPVRDLWLHQDLGRFIGAFSTEVPAHGVALVKIGTAAQPAAK